MFGVKPLVILHEDNVLISTIIVKTIEKILNPSKSSFDRSLSLPCLISGIGLVFPNANLDFVGV